MAIHHRRRGSCPPDPLTKVTTVGNNEIYCWKNLVRSFLGPRPPPSPYPSNTCDSPLLCQRLLAHLSSAVRMEVAGEVVRLMHYLNDFLLYGRDERAVALKLDEFKNTLGNAGFIISTKSSKRPLQKLTFLVKIPAPPESCGRKHADSVCHDCF